MDAAVGWIEVERRGDTFVLTPQQNLRELDHQGIERGRREVLLRLAADSSVRNVVVDFARAGRFGCTTLRLLLGLWRGVQAREGRMALCNVSAQEEHVLTATGLAGFWPAYAAREEAVEAVDG